MESPARTCHEAGDAVSGKRWRRALRLARYHANAAEPNHIDHPNRCYKAAIHVWSFFCWGRAWLYEYGGYCEINEVAASLALDGMPARHPRTREGRR